MLVFHRIELSNNPMLERTCQYNFYVSLNQLHFASGQGCVWYLWQNTAIAFQCSNPFQTFSTLLGVLQCPCSIQFLPYVQDLMKTVWIVLPPDWSPHHWIQMEPTGTAYLLTIGEHDACLQWSGHHNWLFLTSSPFKSILDMHYNIEVAAPCLLGFNTWHLVQMHFKEPAMPMRGLNPVLLITFLSYCLN